MRRGEGGPPPCPTPPPRMVSPALAVPRPQLQSTADKGSLIGLYQALLLRRRNTPEDSQSPAASKLVNVNNQHHQLDFYSTRSDG